MSSGSLEQAVRNLGASDKTLEGLVELLRSYERTVERGTGFNVREEVTGPILDAAVGHGRTMSKTLENGLKFSFHYTSKILRDFLMSDEPNPDHVWEPQTTRTLLELTKNARNIVIGGAYIGDHAVPVANQICDSGVVHCFELSEDNISLLRKNADDNGLGNVEVNRLGLWSVSNARLRLWGDDSHASPQIAEEDGEGVFDTVTIDGYCEERGLSQLDLIMLDIEGGELEAMRGARHHLSLPPANAPVVIFEVHRSYVDWSNGLAETEIIRLLRDSGYAVYAIRDYQSNVSMKDRMVELVELDDIYLEGPPHGFNMLATKRPDELDPNVFKKIRGVSPKLMFHRSPDLHAPIA